MSGPYTPPSPEQQRLEEEDLARKTRMQLEEAGIKPLSPSRAPALNRKQRRRIAAFVRQQGGKS